MLIDIMVQSHNEGITSCTTLSTYSISISLCWYKVCLTTDAAGDGRNTHLCIFLIFMKASHDDELTWH